MSAAAVIGGMSFSPSANWQLQHVGVEAILVQVSTPAPQTLGRLFAVSPDVAELLAVVALGKSVLGYISLHPDSNVAEAWQTENFLGLCRPRQGYDEQGQILDSLGGDQWVAVICLTLTTSKSRFTSLSEISSAGVLCGRWRITAFRGFLNFGKKE
jgi:hypothetical protein